MPKTYAQLRNEMEALQHRMEAARRKEGAGALKEIRKLASLYGFTAEDVFGDGPKGGTALKTSSQAPTQDGPKYQDGHGNSWSGRGPRPRWLREALERGEAIESFLVAAEGTGGVSAANRRAPAKKRRSAGRRPAAKKASRRTAEAPGRKAASKKAAKPAARKRKAAVSAAAEAPEAGAAE
ncbi:H-NS histone family protein [Eleftheria terrae]|uniref:H-NS histone family protein n=1 Tax=Eleftheria terrae TaxID=1597781 RepID=UPI00263AF2D2|nr:H-NS histone family protein [Eleftheria terrae]WKB50829.1 H-NS histone family protein [Eleftheria terrae]